MRMGLRTNPHPRALLGAVSLALAQLFHANELRRKW
jgi:hypothetical protein